MEEKTKQYKKVIIVAVALIILVGMIMVAWKGFVVGIEYAQNTCYQIKIEDGYTVEEIKKIVKEVYGKKTVLVEDVEIFHEIVSIRVKDGTEEELDLLLAKINETYGVEQDTSTIKIDDVPAVRLREIAAIYSKPILVSIVFVLIYIAIRYRRLGIKNVLIGFLIDLIVASLLLLSIIAIIRIPISSYVISAILVIAISGMIFEVTKLEKLCGKVK